MYKAIDIAKWFIDTASKDGKTLTKMKLLKLCFIAQGVHLAAYQEALFSDSVQAWKYGPVINSLYEVLSQYRNNPIPTNDYMIQKAIGIDEGDIETLEILKVVWSKFKNHSAFVLSEWTHREGSAWDKAYNNENGKYHLGYEISHALIIEEFDKLVKSIAKKQRKTRPGMRDTTCDVG